ncbi:hypothetical protein OIU78_014095 [Salix suchowensis]|nr:hypothetical protein OIU78_014095 [Salix suchowensis]
MQHGWFLIGIGEETWDSLQGKFLEVLEEKHEDHYQERFQLLEMVRVRYDKNMVQKLYQCAQEKRKQSCAADNNI